MDILTRFIYILCQLLAWLIFARAIMSWFPLNPRSGLVNFIYEVTEPILGPLRRAIPPLGGTIDISPMLAFIVLQIIAQVILTF